MGECAGEIDWDSERERKKSYNYLVKAVYLSFPFGKGDVLHVLSDNLSDGTVLQDHAHRSRLGSENSEKKMLGEKRSSYCAMTLTFTLNYIVLKLIYF